MTDSSDFAAQRQKEIDDANKNPRSANFTTPSGAQGVTNPKFAQYAERYPDLKADYNKNWKAKGVSLAEYGASHYSSYGKNEGRLLSGPAKKESSGPSSSGVTQTTTATPAPVQAPPEIAYEGPAPPDLSTFDPTPVGISTVEPLLSEVVTDGPRSEVVSNRVASLVDTNSPVFRAAAGQAMRVMNARGLANSSMAQEAVMDAVLKVAVPIAMADAQTFSRQRMLNQGTSNEFRAAQNASFYGQMEARLSGAINETLQHIAGGYSLTQAKINDVTKRYVADLSADTTRFTAMLSADTQKYVADLQYSLGMEGIQVDAANIMGSINDNLDATSYIWDMIFGDNVNPADWAETWVDSFEPLTGSQ
jgi:hypothetical protein